MQSSQPPILPPTPLETILSTIRSMSRSETDKGTAFEDLCMKYLRHEPEYSRLYSEVQSYRDWAEQHGKPLGLTPTDKGIDLVATTTTGEYVAVQCKCYAPDHIVAKPDINSFLAASGNRAFSARLLIDTTLKPLGSNADEMLNNQSIPVTRIDLLKLESSLINWAEYKISQPTAPLFDGSTQPAASDEIPLKPKHKPQAYQQDAINTVLEKLKTADRGKLIMACGTGKTFTALKIAEAQTGAGKSILFLVPSLALLSQTLTEWSQQSEVSITAFAVCSDSEVGKLRSKKDDDNDTVHMALHELAYPATTNAASLAKQHTARHNEDAMTVVFSTYHSIDVLREAQAEHGLPEFDLAVCDEAHRTTGVRFEGEDESAFVRIHDNTIIKAKKRLYMTATPRIYGVDESKKKKTAQRHADLFSSANPDDADTLEQITSSILYSMDNETLYGEELHHLSFSDAVREKLLVPYKVIVLTVDEKDVGERLDNLLNDGNNNLQVGDAARIVGCYKALAKAGEDWGEDRSVMQRAVAFCQIIGENRQGQLVNPGKKIAARQIAEQFKRVTREYQKNPLEGDPTGIEFDADFVHGGMDASAKSEKLNWLKAPAASNQCRVLTNVRCLSEGVDVPALDAVIFLSPRQSQVDIVQSVGRIMRKAPGKERGYIILPVVIPWHMTPNEAMRDNKPWKVVWETLAALKAHDDEGIGRMLDRAEYVSSDPNHFQIIIDPATVRRANKPDEEQPGQDALDRIRTSHNLGNDGEITTPSGTYQQGELWTVDKLERAIRAKVVKKMADPTYWDRWSSGIARIAQMQIDRIRSIIENPDTPDKLAARAAFDNFADQLRKHINSSTSDAEIIEMIAQHLITAPVFDALFASSQFSQNNPISADLQAISEILIRDLNLGKEHQELEGFYNQIRKQSEDIQDPAARQKLIVRLYDQFFASAFKRVVKKHGIVYTPVEIVDFILHSVSHVLQTQFGKTLDDPEVQVLDPFTGTGTFIARLLTSSLIDKEKLPQVYQNQLHATEILLLPYYIAAVNIESIYAGMFPEQAYTPFPGILLADTFNIPTGAINKGTTQDLVEQDKQVALAANNARRKRQMDSKITVIVGNPPYSVGQENQNDNNQNVAYPELDSRIQTTYVAGTKATNKNALYDSYIRAIRWASDRIDPQAGGVIGFVTNAGWVDTAAMAGLRKCLMEEFSSLYVFHLRGNQRTIGEESRREGGKVFGSGSRAPIAISILVKAPAGQEAGTGLIHFCDIGDYLSTEQKLQKLAALQSIAGIAEQDLWQYIEPDAHGDWLRQREAGFADLLPLGDKENKNKPGNTGIFINYSNGIQTNRDAWCNNPSQTTLLENISRLVDSYEQQRAVFIIKYPDINQRKANANNFVDSDPTKISWSSSLLADLVRDKELKFNPHAAVPTLYRPFSKSWLYYDDMLNHRVYQMPQIFPLPVAEDIPEIESAEAQGALFDAPQATLFSEQPNVARQSVKNRVICVTGVGSRSFSVLMADQIPSLDCIEKGQCFPRYLYNKATGARKDTITDATLAAFHSHYPKHAQDIDKDQIFDYLYGILHSPDYRRTYAHNLTKELPRIPFAATWEDFCAFVSAGKQLGDLHVNFESAPLCNGVDIVIHKKGCATLADLAPQDFHVQKMTFGKTGTGKAKNRSTIVYNPAITVRNIPEKTYSYIVNGRSAIDWVVERQCVKTDKDSGIVSDANRYATETMSNPRYPLELLLRVITVSLKTLYIVEGLPPLSKSTE